MDNIYHPEWDFPVILVLFSDTRQFRYLSACPSNCACVNSHSDTVPPSAKTFSLNSGQITRVSIIQKEYGQFAFQKQFRRKTTEKIEDILDCSKAKAATKWVALECKCNSNWLTQGTRFFSFYVLISIRSENCGKFSPANKRHRNWEPMHQSPTLRVTIDAIGQCG